MNVLKNQPQEQEETGFASLSVYKPLPSGKDQYPIEYIEHNGVIKLREEKDCVITGVCEIEDQDLLESLRHFHDKKIMFRRIERAELSAYLAEQMAQIGTPEESGKKEQEKLQLDRLANDAPIVNLINSIMIEAIRKNASDIHIECYSDNAIVRYRIDGTLRTVLTLEKDKFPAVSSRIKIMANLNIMEKRLPQDGRITVHLEKDIVDLRVSIIPIAEGESVVLRLFNKKKNPLGLEQLGLLETELGGLQSLYKRHHGLVLVTGPTGSGKTTTLNAILRQIKSDTTKIITIEDPIEYVIDGINQIQTYDKIGLTFDSILQRVLRQDPDIIMVGEIRDSQTAELAVRAALTGHLVFSTLHTNDTVTSISRLKNMGIEPFLLAAVFRGAIAQRLVRKLCDDCKQKAAATPAQRALLAANGFSRGKICRPVGCEKCNNTGYRGRTGIFEIFTSDEDVEAMIVKNMRDTEIKNTLVEQGMTTLLSAGLQKVASGQTTIEEIERVVTA
ncbi:MAG: type II/IV secretion system protein [Spirochaetaceae bacterium]|nr:MAG: type II/IV secretion system protein [Spirochaetaceae bacterium]